jgi:hypothetical protein
VDEEAFWALIDRLDWRHEGDDERVVKPVVKALAKLALGDIQSFEEILAQKLFALDGREWARNIGGGWWGGDPPVSVDEFLYARCVVVANGEAYYKAVLADPAQMPKDMEFEALLVVGAGAWEAKTGDDEPVFETSVSYETFSNDAGWPPGPPEPRVERPARPAGEDKGTRVVDVRRQAVRRVVRGLVTGELTHPTLDAYLARTGKVLKMTPGGLAPPPEPRPTRGGASSPWTAVIPVWAIDGTGGDRSPTGLVAVIDLERHGPDDVRSTLADVRQLTNDDQLNARSS